MIEIRELWRSELKAHMASNKAAKEEPAGSMFDNLEVNLGGKLLNADEGVNIDGVAHLLKMLMNQDGEQQGNL